MELAAASPLLVNDVPLMLLDMCLRGATVALLLLLAGVMRRDRPTLAAARVGVAMALGLCVQVFASTPLLEAEVPAVWQAPLVAVSVGNAALFWIFVQALFDDEFRWRPLHGVAWLSVAALSGVNCAIVSHSASVLAPVTLGLQRAAPVVFAVLAAIAAAYHWRDDLVEARRRLRAFVLLAGIGYTLASLAARLGSPHGRLVGMTATLDVAALLLIVIVLMVRLMRLSSSDLFPSSHRPASLERLDHGFEPPAPTDNEPTEPGALPPQEAPAVVVAPDPAEERLAHALQQLMAVERAYRREGLSLTTLALELNVPEYRLRRLINQRLGFRNFNAFVNAFRLEEVRAALRNPEQRDLPVLTLALESGFQSIGPFNRAFKALTGMTPTEYRKENSTVS